MTEPRFEPALEAKLKRMQLRVELPDRDTLAVKRVPASHRSFNKSRTNVLIKRTAEGMPSVVCVDDDLDYLGTDQTLAQAFAAGPKQQGWRILTLGGSLHGDLPSVLNYALGILGADEEKTEATANPDLAPRTLLRAWAEDLSEKVSTTTFSTLFRDEAIEQVAGCALGWQGRLPLVLGAPGTGKTNLLHGVARALAGRKKQVLSVNMGALMAGTLFESEREALLTSLLREVRDSGRVLAMEQAEWAMIGVPRGQVLLREALDKGARLIATSAPDHERRFAMSPLGSRLEIVRIGELCASDTCRVLEALRVSIATHHGVQFDAEIEHAVVERSLSMEGALPGKAIRLLDSAAARATLAGCDKVSFVDVYVAASRLLVEAPG